MGYYATRKGKYYATMGTWEYDYLKTHQSKEYYDSATFNVTVENLETGQEKCLEVPVSNFVKIKKLRKNYTWEHDDDSSLGLWLFNKVLSREKIYAKLCINTYTGQYPTHYNTFYVASQDLDNIVLSEEDNNIIFEIKDWEWFDKVHKKTLEVIYVDRDGLKYGKKKKEKED